MDNFRTFVEVLFNKNMSDIDFDEIVPRKGSGALKWDLAAEDVLPMWVADMDFKAARPIRKAMEQRLDHGVFGYSVIPDSYYDAVISWFELRHGWKIEREWIVPVTGVIPALSSVIRTFVPETGKVLLQGPVYNHFYINIARTGREMRSASLRLDGNRYEMDFDALEKYVSDPDVKLMMLCNPHNPVGRVWTAEELRKVGEICSRYETVVVCDEIHCELVRPGLKYRPFASVSEKCADNSITCVSPTKPFNIAGVQVANMIVPNPELREAVRKTVELSEIGSPNIFGIEALTAAYTEGGEWIDALNEYIAGNFRYMRAYCADHLPDYPLTDMEGTYLAWMDCSASGMSSGDFARALKECGKLWLMSGSEYGIEGEGWMRWNLACPRKLLEDGLVRFTKFVQSL